MPKTVPEGVFKYTKQQHLLKTQIDHLVESILRERKAYWDKFEEELKTASKSRVHLLGWTQHAVNRLRRAAELLIECHELKKHTIRKSLSEVCKKEIRELRQDFRDEIRHHLDCMRRLGGVPIPDETAHGNTRIPTKTQRYIKGGVTYRLITMEVLEDDFLKMRALLVMDGSTWTGWLRKAMKYYVGHRFKKLAEIQNVGQDNQEPITDEEVDRFLREAGDKNAEQQNESKGEEKEILDPKQSPGGVKEGGQ